MTMIERVVSAIENGPWGLITKSDALLIARAAIEAMREPTEGMIEKGVWSRSASGRYEPHDIAATIWGAMIDAALVER